MSRLLFSMVLPALAWLGGCAAPAVDPAPAEARPAPATLPADPLVATAGEAVVTRSQLNQALLESHGLNTLLSVMQLQLAREEMRRLGLAVSPQEIEAEKNLWVAEAFADAEAADYPRLLEQLLERQRLSRGEFNLAMETNAHLRKVVTPQVAARITPADVQEAFNLQYGQTVRARHIQVANMQEVAEVQRRLAGGEDFAEVARAMSRNPRTRGLGGQIPPFSREFQGYPQAFRDTAFALEAGEVSDPVMADGSYHLIKVEEKISPKAVKFEDVQESVRQDLEKRLVQAGIRVLRNDLGQRALRTIQILDPTLQAEFQSRRDRQQAQEDERQRVLAELERERAARNPSGEEPSTPPARPAATLPAAAPPATAPVLEESAPATRPAP